MGGNFPTEKQVGGEGIPLPKIFPPWNFTENEPNNIDNLSKNLNFSRSLRSRDGCDHFSSPKRPKTFVFRKKKKHRGENFFFPHPKIRVGEGEFPYPKRRFWHVGEGEIPLPKSKFWHVGGVEFPYPKKSPCRTLGSDFKLSKIHMRNQKWVNSCFSFSSCLS